MVKRYDLHFGGAVGDYIDEVDDGDYVSHSDYAALEARVAELEKDAARYRWLRDIANDSHLSVPMVVSDPLGEPRLIHGDDLDAALDFYLKSEA